MFGSIGFIARTHLRRRFGSVVVIAVVAAIVGGVSLALIAGSRRSASVVDRYFARSTPYDLTVYAPKLSREQVRSMPHVVRADPSTYLGMVPVGADGTASTTTGINGLGVDIEALDDTFVITDGTRPPPNDVFAGLVNPAFVKEFGTGVGDDVQVQMFSKQDDPEATAAGIYRPTGPKYTFHITGVVRTPTDVATNQFHPVTTSTGGYVSDNQMLVPIAFYEQHRNEFWEFGQAFWTQLDDARSREAFLAALERAYPKPAADEPGVGVDETPFDGLRGSFKTPVDLETNALLALGIALAAAGATVIAFMVRADHRRLSRDDPTLRALGSTRVELGIAAVLRTALVSIIGAAGAFGLAWVLSPRFPIGVGRLLELDPGSQINATVLVCGAAALAVFVSASAFTFAYRSSARHAPLRHRSWLTPWLSRSGAPNDVVLGSHLAFGRSTQTGTATTRSAVIGGAIALSVVVAAGMFVNGIDDLYSRPAAHGWSWDLAIGNVNFDMPDPPLRELTADPSIKEQTRISYGQATINGRSEEVLAFDPGGAAPPRVLSGRLPQTENEIVLGPRLRDALGVRAGDNVELSVAGGEFATGDGPAPTKHMTVVGEALTPLLGESELSTGAIVTLDAIKAAGGATAPKIVLVRLHGHDKAAQIAALRRRYTPEMETDAVPARIVNLHRVRSLPLLGLGLAALLGVVLLAYTLFVTVRSRTRELGVLRALGLSARSTSRVLTWQGVVMACTIAIVGIPLGILVGSYAWRAMAESLGVSRHTVYGVWIPLTLVAVVLVGVACSWLPARRARKTNVATLLRVE